MSDEQTSGEPQDSVESTVALFRCQNCGDEIRGRKHGNHTGYDCFACGGSIRYVRDLEPEEADR